MNLGSLDDTFFQLIEKAGKEHPYHVLFIVMALCNIEDESTETTGSGRRGKMSRKSQSTNAAANEVLLFRRFPWLQNPLSYEINGLVKTLSYY